MSVLKRFEDMTGTEKDNECSIVYYPIAEFIYPRLKYFRECVKMTYPAEFNSMEEWNNILDKMLFAFDFTLNEMNGFSSIDFDTERYQTALDKANEGFKLFGEYFLNLWD